MPPRAVEFRRKACATMSRARAHADRARLSPRLSRWMALALMHVCLVVGSAEAGTAPDVCWTADFAAPCTCPAAAEAIAAPTTSFRLFVEPGLASSSGSLCEFTGAAPDGDEVCAVAIGLESTSSEVSLDGFIPNVALVPGVVWNSLGPNNLVLNFFNPSGQSSCVELGTVTVSHSSGVEGTSPLVRLTATTSEWTNAALGTETFGAIPLPEPGLPMLLAAGVFFLLVGGRRSWDPRRKRFSSAPMLVAISGVLFSSLFCSSEVGAFEHFDLNTFSARASGGRVRLDFDGIPLNQSGVNALTNGAERRGLVWNALGIQGDITLNTGPGQKQGAFLIRGSVGRYRGVASPGGTQSHEDSISLQFTRPVRGAGIRVIDATDAEGGTLDANDSVRFLDAYGHVLASYSLADAKTGQSAFVGYVARPGTLPIAAIEVIESGDAVQIDDIYIDDIVFIESSEPFADDWRDLSRGVPQGQASPPSQEDPALALDAPDSRFLQISPGSFVVLTFNDNALIASQDADIDLRIYATPDVLPSTKAALEISADGKTWISLGGLVPAEVVDFDLDAFPAVTPGAHYHYLRFSGMSGDYAVDAVEALSSTDIIDTDLDGTADGLDNCVSLPNPSQADADGDGIGNRCDVCRDVPDPLQSDGDGNGVGDVCESPLLELVLDPIPSSGVDSLTGGDLFLDCGGADIQSLNFAVRTPPGASSFVFGVPAGDPSTTTGCTAPPVENLYSPFPAETGCLGATALGATLDPVLSGAAVGSPGIGYPDGLYAFLTAGAGVTDLICSAGQTDVYLGRVNFMTSAAQPSSVRVGLSQAGNLLDWFGVTGLTSIGQPLKTRVTQTVAAAAPPGGFSSEGGIALMTAAITTSAPPEVVLELRPSGSAGVASGQAWDLCLTDESILRMARVTVGIEGPEGASDPADMYVQGCTDAAALGGLVSCSTDPAAVGPTVDDAASYAFGPLAPGSLPLEGALAGSTLYLSLNGSYSDAFASGLLNASTSLTTCVATVVIADTAHVPSLTLVGVEDLTSPDEPLLSEYGVVSDPDAAVVRNTSYDTDGDAILEGDNCVLVANSDQSNSGGFKSSLSDFDPDGDACECGDGNSTGAVWESGIELSADVEGIRSYLASLNSDTSVRLKCSAVDTTACNMADVVAWYRGLDSGVPVGDGACEAVLGAEPE